MALPLPFLHVASNIFLNLFFLSTKKMILNFFGSFSESPPRHNESAQTAKIPWEGRRPNDVVHAAGCIKIFLQHFQTQYFQTQKFLRKSSANHAMQVAVMQVSNAMQVILRRCPARNRLQ